MARTPRFSVEQVEEALRQSMGVNTIAAHKLGCSPSTVGNYIARSEKLRKAVEEIVEETLDLAETQLFKALREGNLTAVLFYLKTKGKHRGYVERTEISGSKEGSPIEISDARQRLVAAVARAAPEQPKPIADCDSNAA